MRKRTLLFFFYGLFCSSVLQAQYYINDSVTHQHTYQNALAIYFKALGENAPLYNGSEYVNYGQDIVGSPFFVSEEMQKATIDYEGIVYPDIPVWYDLVSDEIIIKDYRQDHYIKLVKEKVSNFYLLNHEFIRLTPDSSTDFSIEPGFYERIYEGNISAFAKRKKTIGYTTGAEKVTYTFTDETSYFILKEDGWFKVKRKASLIALFTTKKNDIRQYYRNNRLNFKRDPEKTLLKIISYYDHLKQ
jgi:hypothetical protein